MMHKIQSALRELWRNHGWRGLIVIPQRGCGYLWRKTFGPGTFRFNGRMLPYKIHPYILDNERVIEIPLAMDFLGAQSGDILEVGNVLSNYYGFPHDIVDKYEKAPGVRNEDIVTYAPGKSYDRIVTLSTLEHVGWDEQPREPEKIERAIERLKGLLKEDGALLATLPMAYNSHFDKLVREGKTGFSEVYYFRRTTANNQWEETTLAEVVATRFGQPYSCANGLFVGIYRRKS